MAKAVTRRAMRAVTKLRNAIAGAVARAAGKVTAAMTVASTAVADVVTARSGATAGNTTTAVMVLPEAGAAVATPPLCSVRTHP
jgi:hypothetical protein